MAPGGVGSGQLGWVCADTSWYQTFHLPPIQSFFPGFSAQPVPAVAPSQCATNVALQEHSDN